MEEEDESTLSSQASGDDLLQSGKRPRLDSGVAVSQESGLWSYAGKNKPVGIAQPFPKKENIDVDLMEDSVELKSELRSGGVGFKGFNIGDVPGKSFLKGGGAESDSDTTSTFEFPFEAPSSSDDEDGIGVAEGLELKGPVMTKIGGGGRDRAGGGGGGGEERRVW